MAQDSRLVAQKQVLSQDVPGGAQEISVWDLVGTPPSRFFFRFGDAGDQAMFRLMRAIAIIDAVWIPVLLSFGQLQWASVLLMHPLCLAPDLAMNCVYFLGVLMQMRTSVVQLAVAQELVDPSTIFVKRMTSSRFWMDFLSVFGAFWCHPAWPNTLAALRLLRLWRLSAGADDLYELHHAQLTSENAFRNFVDLTMVLLLASHGFTCAWFFATTSTDNWEKALQEDPRFAGTDFASLYLVYFSDGAAMLAGWGGPPCISPDGLYSRSELVVWSIAAPASALCTAWVFTQLLEVVQQASAATDKHLNKLSELSSVLDSLFVPPELKQRCLRYHSFLSIHNANMNEYEGLFSSMSVNLQQDIKVHLFDGLVRAAPFFKEVPDEVISRLVLAFEEEVFSPGQHIFHKGEYGAELFFIMRGSVEVLLDNATVVELQMGQFFGELALVLDQPRGATIKAKSFCMFAKLSRETFQEVLAEDPVVKRVIMDEIARRPGVVRDDGPPQPGPGEENVMVTTPLLVSGRAQGAQVRRRSKEGSSNGQQGIFCRQQLKAGLADSEQINRLLVDVGRMTQIIETFQGKCDGIEVRLRNMEACAARPAPGPPRA